MKCIQPSITARPENPAARQQQQKGRQALRLRGSFLAPVLALTLTACPASGDPPGTPTAPQPGENQPVSQAGFISGQAVDTQGRPLANAEVHVYDAGSGGKVGVYKAGTGPDGRFSIRVADGYYGASAYHTVDYNGNRYTFDLHPLQKSGVRYDSATGPVLNFAWRISGPKPDVSPTSTNGYDYYGGYLAGIYPWSRFWSLPDLQGATVELTMTPSGPLIDGSAGRPLTFTANVDVVANDLKVSGRSFAPLDIPIGRYTVTAQLIRANGSSEPLRIAQDFIEANLASFATLELKPNSYSPGITPHKGFTLSP